MSRVRTIVVDWALNVTGKDLDPSQMFMPILYQR